MVKPHTPPHAARRPVSRAASPPIGARPPITAASGAPVAEKRDASPGVPDAPSALTPGMFVLPYLEVSRALLRAHHDALAMMEANRTLSDAMRVIVRRQQDLAFEIAEQAMARPDGAPREAADDRATMFHRAAEAVRELGEAMIAAQLSALATLRDRARAPDPTPPDRDSATRH